MRRLALLLAGPPLLALAAAAIASSALLAVALGLAALYLSCAVAVRVAARGLRIARTVDRHEVLEGRPVELRFAVSGLRGLPVHVEVRDADGRWAVLERRGGTLACTVDRPGPHVLEASPVRVRDDLGLFSRAARAGRPEPLLVLPVPAPPVAHPRRGGADPVGDPEPDGLRPYVAGTPMSRIHWASAARGGELQERSFATARDRLPLVVVDVAGAEDGAIDWASRTAAGHVLALARSGGCRLLLPGDRVATPVTDALGQWPGVHRRIAALQRDAAVRPAPGEDRDALWVRAAAAPEDAQQHRRPLPPGVVARPVGAAAGSVGAEPAGPTGPVGVAA